MIKENVAEVEARIQAACERAGRRREEVTLIAVSKTKPVRDIYEVMETGIKDFGENKVQEMCDKMEMIQQPLNWHMIGHLQRNKVKYIVDKSNTYPFSRFFTSGTADQPGSTEKISGIKHSDRS